MANNQIITCMLLVSFLASIRWELIVISSKTAFAPIYTHLTKEKEYDLIFSTHLYRLL